MQSQILLSPEEQKTLYIFSFPDFWLNQTSAWLAWQIPLPYLVSCAVSSLSSGPHCSAVDSPTCKCRLKTRDGLAHDHQIASRSAQSSPSLC